MTSTVCRTKCRLHSDFLAHQPCRYCGPSHASIVRLAPTNPTRRVALHASGPQCPSARHPSRSPQGSARRSRSGPLPTELRALP